jgi:hypothetical protein
MKLSEDVQEVYDLFLTILQSETFPDMPNPNIVDMKVAADLATTQFEDRLIWRDVLADQESKVRALQYKGDQPNPELEAMTNFIHRLYQENTQSIYKQWRECEPVRPIEEDNVYEYSYSNLYKIMLARAFQGRTNVFFEKLFEVYKKGGWPCYWEGPIPEGRPIVYSNPK